MPADLNKNPEEMWFEIEPVYSQWYKVKFKKKPTDEQIRWLYSQYLKRIGQDQNVFHAPQIIR